MQGLVGEDEAAEADLTEALGLVKNLGSLHSATDEACSEQTRSHLSF